MATVRSAECKSALWLRHPEPFGLSLLPGSFRVALGLSLLVTLEEKEVLGHGLVDQLLEQEQLGGVDYGMDALLKCLHGGEGLEGIAQEDDGGMTALAHGHDLKGFQGQILINGIGGKQLLDDDHLVTGLVEARQEVAVRGRRVDLVAQILEGGLGDIEPLEGWRRPAKRVCRTG